MDNYVLAIGQVEQRLADLDAHLSEVAAREPYARPVGSLRCLRGVDTVTAMTIVSELHDFARFADPRELMSYLGLTPSEHSSSTRVRRGSITKAGNGHVRRVLVEAAWHYRHRPSVSAALRRRRQGQPAAAIAIADRAQARLHSRFRRLQDGGGKLPCVAAVAIARELVGFVWAVLCHDRLPAAPAKA